MTIWTSGKSLLPGVITSLSRSMACGQEFWQPQSQRSSREFRQLPTTTACRGDFNDTKTAHDGLEALEAGAAFRPDLILLDIGMPRLNGYDTARRIREQPWGQAVRLVALTGWGQEDDRRKSQDAGFDSHIVKPIEPAALEKLLASLQADTA